jgi:hypothetical protein
MPLSVQNGKNIIFKKKANLLMLKRLLFGLTLRGAAGRTSRELWPTHRGLTTACTRRPFSTPLMHVELGRG